MLDDHRHLAVEIVVQRLDQHVALGAVGDRGEAAQIGDEDHRGDHVERAAPDLAVENAPAGLRPDIGVQEIDRDVVAEARLQGQGEARHQMAQDGDVALGKALRPGRRPGREQPGLAIALALEAEPGALRQIVGGALAAQLVEQRKLDRLGAVQPHAQVVQAAIEHALERALQIGLRRVQAMDVDVAADALIDAPRAAHAADARMQRVGAGERAPERHVDRAQPLAEALRRSARSRSAAGPARSASRRSRKPRLASRSATVPAVHRMGKARSPVAMQMPLCPAAMHAPPVM